jgi:hypothetical protein
MELNNNQKKVINTLIYSDIFNFPLTDDELWRNIISNKKIERDSLKKITKSLYKIISYEKGFYCFKGKEGIIDQRLKRKKITQKKLQIARNTAHYLSYIPSILFIGITGRLCHMDADIDDDIDMFFITKKKSVWITRLMILAVLELLNVRRTRADKKPQDKICPNFIIDETTLALPHEKHDLFTAHEIINLHPLFTRNNTHHKFINSNKWITKYYANTSLEIPENTQQKRPKQYLVIKIINFFMMHPAVEYIGRKLQKTFMKKNTAIEAVLPNMLAFYPRDRRSGILKEFTKKRKNFKPELAL